MVGLVAGEAPEARRARVVRAGPLGHSGGPGVSAERAVGEAMVAAARADQV